MLRQGEYTIITFGDSTTAPRTVDHCILGIYSDLLRTELPHHGILGSICNRGIPGNTTADAQARLTHDVLNDHPDLVIMQFGLNDSAIDVWATPPARESRVPLDGYTQNLREMIRRLKARHCRIVLMTPNPMHWTPNLRGQYGKPPYRPESPMGLNVVLTDYVRAVRKVAQEEQVDLVDIYDLFLAYGQQTGTGIQALLLDGMHPNARGHRLVADALKATLLPEPYPLGLLETASLTSLIHRND